MLSFSKFYVSFFLLQMVNQMVSVLMPFSVLTKTLPVKTNCAYVTLITVILQAYVRKVSNIVINPFRTNGIFHKVTYNKVSVVHFIQ